MESQASVGFLLLLGILQVIRGVLHFLWSAQLGVPNPPTLPGVDAYISINPIFLYLAFVDIVLIVMIPLVIRYRVAFFVLFPFDIVLAFEGVWFRTVAYLQHFPWYFIGVSLVSILHLALLLTWDLLIMKESHTA
ncbi:hypothetical protein EU537_07795 [Candidatus Thorarchaeota archaeon]|nr:MAG: hypothetical protein EU537_07795 [Candidatus Thorarchaeota archaeon]